MSEQGYSYRVDIVFCIDATGSMQPHIERVKESAIRFYPDLGKYLAGEGKQLDQLRSRIIAFRDIYDDKAPAFMISPFFNLPDEGEAFSRFVKSITADGGASRAESGIEAVALAIQSDWVPIAAKGRHLIVVYTDADAHPLEKRGEWPVKMTDNVRLLDSLPKTFSELTDAWDGQTINRSARRMILYAPEAYPWSDMFTHWADVLHLPAKAGEGLTELEYTEIMRMIAKSV